MSENEPVRFLERKKGNQVSDSKESVAVCLH